jgi:hypothetical protein
MRSLNTLRIAILTTLMVAVPLAGAYARHNRGGSALEAPVQTEMIGPRITAVVDQVQGVDLGIADARQANTITATEAKRLHVRAARISQAAERVAASDHGRIPTAQYHDLLRRLDSVDQQLRIDTGIGFPTS